MALLLILGVSLGACGADGSSGGRGSDPVAATVSPVDDRVETRGAQSTSFQLAASPRAVLAGDVIRVDEAGFAELGYEDGSMARLGPSTTYEVLELGRSGQDGAQIRGRLDVGRTWHRVVERTATDGAYIVETSVAVASVRGTVFVVECRATEGPCTFEVIEGEVVVDPVDGDPVVIEAGEQVTVGTEARAANPVPLDGEAWLIDGFRRRSMEADDVDGPRVENLDAAGTYEGQRVLTGHEILEGDASGSAPVGSESIATVVLDDACSPQPCVGVAIPDQGIERRGELAWEGDVLRGALTGEGPCQSDEGDLVLTVDRIERADGRWRIAGLTGTYEGLVESQDLTLCPTSRVTWSLDLRRVEEPDTTLTDTP